MQPKRSQPPTFPRRPNRRRAARGLVAVFCCLASASAATVAGREPSASDALLGLAPADAALIVTVDHLRERSRALLDSRLAREVQGLPAYKAWLETDKVRDFLRSRERIEEFLQTSWGEVRDEVLGDAVILALRLPPGSADPAAARGLLILKARDVKLLDRLVSQINEIQVRNGEVADVVDHDRGGTVYHTRTFAGEADRLPESFVVFPDGTFAFANDERLIQEVVDRKAAAGEAPASGSFAAREGFQATSARLPGEAVARLFIEPETARPLLAAAPEAVGEYIGGLDHLGAALVVDDREVAFRAVQAFQPEKFREATRALAAGSSTDRPGARLSSIPTTAAALASLSIDVPTLYRRLVALVPAADQPKVPKLEALAARLLLGLDLKRQVLPALGPQVAAYLEPPDFSAPAASRRMPFPFVVAVEINQDAAVDANSGGAPSVARAVDNALGAVLATLSLDEKRVPADQGVQTREVDGVAVQSLGAALPFAFAVDRPGRRLIVGSSPEAVARYIEAGADPTAGARFQAIRAAAFPDCDSFACLDLAAVHALAVQHRGRIIEATARKRNRPAFEVGRDLDQVLGIVGLFDAAFFTTRVDADRAALEHTLGLLPRSVVEKPGGARGAGGE